MKKTLLLLSSFFLSLFLLTGMVEAKTTTVDKLEVHYIDVGQGDATLIKCGDSAMLIDAGENDKGTLVQNYIKKQGVKNLDYLIVTHPDSDHCGGADVIITKYDINKVIMPDYEKDTNTYRDVIDALDYKNYKITVPVVGNTYKLNDAKFTIIAPNDVYEDANNSSVGIILEHGKKKFIFTGDAEEDAEADIVSNKAKIKADVYKVNHHGSKTSSSSAFLKAIDPVYAVISCGESNEYGHPDAQTLNSLRAMDVKLFRTDEQGSIMATSDGKTITWNASPTETWQAGESKQSAKASSTSKTTGSSAAATTSNIVETPAVAEVPQQEITQTPATITYVLNTKSKKFHKLTCGSLPTANRSDTNMSRDEIIGQGYEPCKKCNP